MRAPCGFDYAVLRVVPRVEREEFLNAGVVVWCLAQDYLAARVALDVDRLKALDAAADVEAIARPSRGGAPHLRRRSGGGAGGAAAGQGAIPLAGVAAEHGAPDLGGALRHHRGSGPGAGAVVPDAGGAARPVSGSPGVARVFLLSPARCDGIRMGLLMRPQASFPLALALRSGQGAPLGEVFSFASGLYFRGKLAYTRAFGRGLVITPGAGLVDPDRPIGTEGAAGLGAGAGGSRRSPLPPAAGARRADARGGAARRSARWFSWEALPATSTSSCCWRSSASGCSSRSTSWAGAT